MGEDTTRRGFLSGLFESITAIRELSRNTTVMTEPAQIITTVYRNSATAPVNIFSKACELKPDEMRTLYQHFGPLAQGGVELRIGGNVHQFDMRMKDMRDGKFILALYENGERAGMARTEGMQIKPLSIYEELPLLSRPTAAPAPQR